MGGLMKGMVGLVEPGWMGWEDCLNQDGWDGRMDQDLVRDQE